MNKGNFLRALSYVYVCEGTGTVHHCTEHCPLERIANDDHTLVCPVSGVQWNNESEVVRSWKLTSKCVPTITADKRDPNMYSRAADGTVGSSTLNIKNEECKNEVKKFLELVHDLTCSQNAGTREVQTKLRIRNQTRQQVYKALEKGRSYQRLHAAEHHHNGDLLQAHFPARNEILRRQTGFSS